MKCSDTKTCKDPNVPVGKQYNLGARIRKVLNKEIDRIDKAIRSKILHRIKHEQKIR